MKLSPHHVGVLALALEIGAGCACDGRNEEDDGKWPPVDAGADTTAPATDAGDAEAGLPTPDAAAPPGTHLWPFPPNDCAIFVPDDLSTVEPLPWEPCPFQPDGCTRAGAPWAQANGWGYGVLLFATTVGADVFYSVGRQAPNDWWESLLFKNDILIGSWLSKTWGDGGQCNAVGPQLWRGEAHMLLIRMQAETSPWLFSAAPDQLYTNPGEPLVFGPPDAAVLPGVQVFRTSKIVLVREAYERFTVRSLISGAIERPEPGAMPYVELNHATPWRTARSTSPGPGA